MKNQKTMRENIIVRRFPERPRDYRRHSIRFPSVRVCGGKRMMITQGLAIGFAGFVAIIDRIMPEQL
jgi:hypothetical protein